MTPYEIHKTLDHQMQPYSPDGYQLIEECLTCGQRWLHDPIVSYPITMQAIPASQLDTWRETGKVNWGTASS